MKRCTNVKFENQCASDALPCCDAIAARMNAKHQRVFLSPNLKAPPEGCQEWPSVSASVAWASTDDSLKHRSVCLHRSHLNPFASSSFVILPFASRKFPGCTSLLSAQAVLSPSSPFLIRLRARMENRLELTLSVHSERCLGVNPPPGGFASTADHGLGDVKVRRMHEIGCATLSRAVHP